MLVGERKRLKEGRYETREVWKREGVRGRRGHTNIIQITYCTYRRCVVAILNFCNLPTSTPPPLVKGISDGGGRTSSVDKFN